MGTCCPQALNIFRLQKVDYRERHPEWSDARLAIEVADSSLKSDLTEKADLYAEAGIEEYWVVEATAKQIHVLRKPAAGEYQNRIVVAEGGSVAPQAAEDAELSVAALFNNEL